MSSNKNSTFICPLPWKHFSTHPNGQVGICCQSSEPYIGIAATNNVLLTIYEKSILQIVNSDSFRQIRRDFLEGKVPLACQGCYQLEQGSSISDRQTYLKKFPLTREKMKKLTSADGSITPEFKLLELRLGNICNLKCITCNPGSSKKWLPDLDQIKKVPNFPMYHGLDFSTQSEFNWPMSRAFWNELHTYTDQVELINMNGGEPFLISEHFEFLQYLIDSSRSSNITLHYNTNGTIRSSQLEKLWPHFKHIKLSISIDDVSKRNEYIRFPAKWDKLVDNLKYFCSGKFDVEIIQTVSAFNFLYLGELHDFLIREGLDINITLNVVTTPIYLSPNIIPADIRKRAILKLLFKYNLPFSREVHTLFFNDYHNASEQLNFFKYVDTLDNIRSLSYKKTFPKLATI